MDCSGKQRRVRAVCVGVGDVCIHACMCVFMHICDLLSWFEKNKTEYYVSHHENCKYKINFVQILPVPCQWTCHLGEELLGCVSIWELECQSDSPLWRGSSISSQHSRDDWWGDFSSSIPDGSRSDCPYGETWHRWAQESRHALFITCEWDLDWIVASVMHLVQCQSYHHSCHLLTILFQCTV